MKTGQKWQLDMGDMKILPGPRPRTTKRPLWIIILVSMVSVFLICAYIYPPSGTAACYIFSSKGCKVITDWLPPIPAREYSDAEIASRIVIREILNTPFVTANTPKIAFLFLTPGSLPFEKLWDKFFHVSFCICIHTVPSFLDFQAVFIFHRKYTNLICFHLWCTGTAVIIDYCDFKFFYGIYP